MKRALSIGILCLSVAGCGFFSQSDSPGNQASSAAPSAAAASSEVAFTEFINRLYKYSVWHPKDCEPGSDSFGVQDARDATNVSFSCGLIIQPQDPAYYDDAYDQMRMPLKDMAEFIRLMNVDDATSRPERRKTVGPLEEITLGEETAYQFTFTHSFVDETGGFLMDGRSTVTFFRNGNINFIAFVKNSDETALAALRTLKFLE